MFYYNCLQQISVEVSTNAFSLFQFVKDNKDFISVLISLLALFISATTAYINLIYRGKLEAVRPVSIFIGCNEMGRPQIQSNLLLTCSSTKGINIREISVELHNERIGSMNFHTWKYRTEKSEPRALNGLHVKKESGDHFFSLEGQHDFAHSEYSIKIIATVDRVFNKNKKIILLADKLVIKDGHNQKLRAGQSGLLFIWREESNDYSSTDKKDSLSEVSDDIKSAPLIFKSIKGYLEYLDDKGHEVSFRTSEHITNIQPHINSIEGYFSVQGTIDHLHHINCDVRLNPPNAVSVVKNLAKENLVNGEYFSDYSLILKDSFKEEVEYWKIGVQSYCMFYEFQVILPKNREIQECALYHTKYPYDPEARSVFNPQNLGPMRKLTRAHSMIIRRQNQTVICLQLTGISTLDYYMLKWKLSPNT